MGGLFLQSYQKQKLELEAGLSPEFQNHFGKQREHIAKEEEKNKRVRKWTRALFFMLTWGRRVRIRKHDSISKENLESFGSKHR